MEQLFIGLDVHKKTWAVTIQEQQLIRNRFTQEADAEVLINYIQTHYPPRCWRKYAALAFAAGRTCAAL